MSHWIVMGVLLAVTYVSFSLVNAHESRTMRVSFLDVGQGDSILVQSPTGTYTLIDAGPNGAVLNPLGLEMSLFTRTIDLIIGTHPDGDHVGGFPDVLSRYRVKHVVYQGMEHDAPAADAFEQALIKWRLAGANRVVDEPHRGDVYDLGGGAYLTVLYPDRASEGDDTNMFSVVARLQYGDTSFVFTGDAPQEVEEHLISLDGAHLQTNILKLGHHGSKTSSSEAFLKGTAPDVAVISRGCDNSYGHPHKEVIDRLDTLHITYVDTCKEGTISFVSDGVTVVQE